MYVVQCLAKTHKKKTRIENGSGAQPAKRILPTDPLQVIYIQNQKYPKMNPSLTASSTVSAERTERPGCEGSEILHAIFSPPPNAAWRVATWSVVWRMRIARRQEHGSPARDTGRLRLAGRPGRAARSGYALAAASTPAAAGPRRPNRVVTNMTSFMSFRVILVIV